MEVGIMQNSERFQELCRRAEEEQNPASETGQQMMELLQDEELELLAQEREQTYKRRT